MTVTKLEDVHSVDEFRRLYYPGDGPVLDYFGGSGPENGTNDHETGRRSSEPLDLFARILTENE